MRRLAWIAVLCGAVLLGGPGVAGEQVGEVQRIQRQGIVVGGTPFVLRSYTRRPAGLAVGDRVRIVYSASGDQAWVRSIEKLD